MRELKYFAAFSLPLITLAALLWPEYLCFAGVLYSFGFSPLLELILKPDPINHSEDEEAELLANRLYDWMLYAIVPVQVGLIVLFLYRVSTESFPLIQLIGMTGSVGMCCGSLGINVGHELGHRTSRFERFLAQTLLLTSLYMHFTIEHNRGHHKRVATPLDPATARRNETLYAFWLRCIPGVFAGAWKLGAADARKHNRLSWGLSNPVARIVLIEVALVTAIGIFLGPTALFCFLGAALTGIQQLETVNYIEHYGLQRKEIAPGKYERVQPWHSWNSDHVLGRILLFELTRHSDHHYSASRRFQILRHMPNSPQLPVGYPAAMIMSLCPPLWFRYIHPRLEQLNEEGRATAE